MFSIKSSTSDRELQFSAFDHDEFTVSLAGLTPRATLRVYAYTDGVRLLAFFQDLAAQITPWAGEKSWGSIEGEFNIRATCSAVGKVTFRVDMWGNAGMQEEWRLSAGLEQEMGALTGIAQKASSFFVAAAPNNSLQGRRP